MLDFKRIIEGTENSYPHEFNDQEVPKAIVDGIQQLDAAKLALSNEIVELGSMMEDIDKYIVEMVRKRSIVEVIRNKKINDLDSIF